MPAGWYEGKKSGEYANFWGAAGEYRGPKYGMLHDKMPPVRFLDAVHGSILVFYNCKFRCITADDYVTDRVDKQPEKEQACQSSEKEMNNASATANRNRERLKMFREGTRSQK
jgi:hypothetical protein